MKKIFPLLLIVAIMIIILMVVILVTSYQHQYYESEYEEMFPIVEFRIVTQVPHGFVSLNSILETLNQENSEVLNYTTWSGNLWFRDADQIVFEGIYMADSSFIVKYQNQELYVHEMRFSWFVQHAINIYELRNKTYNIGDTVELRGRSGITYNFVITSVERSNVDEEVLYEIKFMISPSISERDMSYLFIHAELRDGTTNDNFIIIDEETVHIQISNSEEISLITVQSPNRHLGRRNTTRKIRIGQWYEGEEEYSVDVDGSGIDN